MSALLEVRNIRKHYTLQAQSLLRRGSVLKAVDGVSFSLKAGQTLGIVGESGCGKSTTGRLVMGAVSPTSGDIHFEGQPVRATFDKAWRAQRRRIQMVYQNPLGALDRRLKVGDQVTEPLAIHGIDTRNGRQDRALNLFEAVGLRRELWDRYPHELSGGQRQRVVIARALVLEPSLIICDEPVSALDVSVAAQIINLLEDIQARFGVGYVFISHDLKIVRQIAHQVAVMYLGRIVERGAPDEVFHSPVHPYTRALVSAIPMPGRRTRDRILLSGDPPNPVNVPSGCAFHTRCAMAQAVCREQTPQLRPTMNSHRYAACHLAPGGPPASGGEA